MRAIANCVLVTTAALKHYQSDTPYRIIRDTTSSLAKAGLIPVIIGPDSDRATILQLYRQCAGVVFAGGSDWNPKIYNQRPAPETEDPDDDRDELEQTLLTKALLDKKPIVGICRGMQGLAISHYRRHAQIAKESIIIQDISLVTDRRHNTGYLNMAANKHEVIISPNTIAHEVFGNSSVMMPKGNHQAVSYEVLRKLPAIKVSGISSIDNMTEIIELDRAVHPFCLATQGHPEIDGILSALLFRRLSSEMKNYASTAYARPQLPYSYAPFAP